MSRTSRRIVAAAAALTLSLSLTACGDDSGASGGSPSSGGTKDLGSATIVLGSKVISWAPAYVAVCEGYFKKHGLDVTLTASQQGTTSAIAGMVSGDALSAMTGAPAAISPIREGAPVQLLFGASVGYSVQVVASNKMMKDKGLTANSSLEDRVKALKGETVAILTPGDSIDQLLRFVMPKYGLDPDKDIKMQPLNTYANMFSAMRQGSIGVLAGSPPNGDQAEAQGIGKILFSGDEFKELKKYPYLIGLANTRQLKENPDRYKALVAGFADAMNLMRTTPDKPKPCLQKEFPDVDQKTFDASYEYTVKSLPASPLITEDAFKALTDFAKASGKPVDVDYSKAVAADVVKQAIG
ncbi:ABC transporter substrate-binding protein [Actinophytocola oryzae]|uniref:NitT/TauT family transport system substrate-binding protein n=1 Tax=Actinophytocola oryzae TaxID=502181 RepID=A0A4R7W2K8_9PSEU|nr:ABC transporter substrate-binding protein [Actinophytocola oryzae]TDV56365.1 NitT/TauT family transport system substrate-binding protein [Actinophytocola oryzae]